MVRANGSVTGVSLRYWRWSAGAQLLRLPSMMAPLAFAVVAIQVTGSYRLGGLLMALFVGAEVVGAGPVGRVLDRVGLARGLRVLLVLCALCLCGLAMARTPGLMIVFVVLTGLVAGGLSGGIRALLPTVVAKESLERAVAIDAMIIEGVVVSGPLVVAVLSPFGGVVPVLGMAGSFVLAAFLVPGGTIAPRVHGVRPPLGPIASWLLCAFAFGHVCSTIEVASLPLGQRIGGGPVTAVVMIAVLTGASLLGSALYALCASRISLDREVIAVLALLCMVAGAVLVAFGTSWPTLIAGVLTVGICLGPLNTTMSVRLQVILPDERKAEGFALVFTAQATGFALGSLSVSVLPLLAAPLVGASVAMVAAGLVATRHRNAHYRRVASGQVTQEARS